MKPGYKQTEIGVIPEDWEIRFLPFFGDVVSGGTPSTNISAYWNGDIAWCTPSDITSTAGIRIIETEKRITEQGLSKSAAILLPPGSLLLCTRATIGDAKINSVPMATNQGFKNVVPKNCNIFFLYYLLQTKKKEMLEKAIGSTFLEISKSSLCSIPLQYPQLPEQDRIAEALSDMDELIASLEKLIAKKKAIKQGAMQELLTGKRRLPGFSGEWKTSPLITLCDSITDGSHESPLETDCGYYMPSVKDMTDCGFNYSACKQISKLDYEKLVRNGCQPVVGDVLIAKDGSILKHAFVYEQSVPTVILSSIAIIRPNKAIIDSQYLAQYFRQKSFVENVILNYKSGTGVPRIVLNNFKIIEIFHPISVKEQIAISETLGYIDVDIEMQEKKVEKARQIKQGMMQQLLTGKIRI